MAATTTNQKLENWVAHWARILEPDRIEWCDGSDEEWERLAQLLGLAGWRDDWKVSGGLPPLPSADMDAVALEAAAVGKRLDVQAAEQAVDARLKNLALTRHFRWLNQLDIGVFRDQVSGGTSFTGPNAVVEIPLFDQRQAQLLEADAQLRTALRTLESVRINARAEIRINAADMRGARLILDAFERVAMPKLARFTQVVRHEMPGALISSVRVIAFGDRNAIVVVYASRPGDLVPRGTSLIMSFRAATQRVISIRRTDDMGVFQRLRAAMDALHFADFDAPVVRILYAGAGFALILLPILGIVMWVLRRRDSCTVRHGTPPEATS